MTDVEKFELPPIDSCHLRTHEMMIEDAIVRGHRDSERIVRAKLIMEGFNPDLPYTERFESVACVWRYRQQFLVFPNGDEYMCVRKGTDKAAV